MYTQYIPNICPTRFDTGFTRVHNLEPKRHQFAVYCREEVLAAFPWRFYFVAESRSRVRRREKRDLVLLGTPSRHPSTVRTPPL